MRRQGGWRGDEGVSRDNWMGAPPCWIQMVLLSVPMATGSGLVGVPSHRTAHHRRPSCPALPDAPMTSDDSYGGRISSEG